MPAVGDVLIGGWTVTHMGPDAYGRLTATVKRTTRDDRDGPRVVRVVRVDG